MTLSRTLNTMLERRIPLPTQPLTWGKQLGPCHRLFKHILYREDGGKRGAATGWLRGNVPMAESSLSGPATLQGDIAAAGANPQRHDALTALLYYATRPPPNRVVHNVPTRAHQIVRRA